MNTKSFRRLFLVTLLFAALGSLLGIIGISIENHNEQIHGASYPNYDWELLSIFSLPGSSIVGRDLGYDLGLGELRYYFWKAVAWNSAFYAASAAILILPGLFFSLPKDAKSPKPTHYSTAH